MITEEQLDMLVAVVDLRDAANELRTTTAGDAAFQDLTRDLSAIASHLIESYLAELPPSTRKAIESNYRMPAAIVEVES